MAAIEWCTKTWNWLAGCNKVSPGCRGCYALRDSIRFAANSNAPARYKGGIVANRQWTGRVSYDAESLAGLFATLGRWRRPQLVFCNSMSDTFNEQAPPESFDELAASIHHRVADIESGLMRTREHGTTLRASLVPASHRQGPIDVVEDTLAGRSDV